MGDHGSALILSLVLVRNLSVENPGKKQILLETGVSFLHDFFKDILGEEGKMYIPYLMTVVIYIGIANIFRCVWICTAYKGFELYDRSCTHKYFSDRVCRIIEVVKGFLKSFDRAGTDYVADQYSGGRHSTHITLYATFW